MCGIAGFVGGEQSEETAKQMLQKLRHRGPDGDHTVVAPGAVLAHARLAVIDPSSLSDQPFFSADKRYVLVFNGEIYNYRELRNELKAQYMFTTDGDVEVLLALLILHGASALSRVEGMYAFALYDTRERSLLVARDPFGEKPLFYWHKNDEFVFASELGALVAHSRVPRVPSEESFYEYMVYGAVPAPNTALAEVKQLEPGVALLYKQNELRVEHTFSFKYKSSRAPYHEACEQTERLLRSAVGASLVADVPVGVFLSGGIDSTAVALEASRQQAGIETFSIGFEDASYDESGIARQTAQMLGTTHHELIISTKQLITQIPQCVKTLSEPLADQSYVPTYFLSKFARERVTVALGGDGGDEFLFGYPTFLAERFVPLLSVVPQLFDPSLFLMSKTFGNSGYMNAPFLVERFLRARRAGGAGSRHALWLAPLSPAEMRCVAKDTGISSALGNADRLFTNLDQADHENSLANYYASAYLSSQVLVKSDRASMQHGLEVRAPFLNPRLVSNFLSLPPKYRRSLTRGKRVLRDVVRGKVPDRVINGKKHGFAIPLGEWLRGPLSGMLEELLSDSQTVPFVDRNGIQILVREHLRGVDHGRALYALITYASWYNRIQKT